MTHGSSNYWIFLKLSQTIHSLGWLSCPTSKESATTRMHIVVGSRHHYEPIIIQDLVPSFTMSNHQPSLTIINHWKPSTKLAKPPYKSLGGPNVGERHGFEASLSFNHQAFSILILNQSQWSHRSGNEPWMKRLKPMNLMHDEKLIWLSTVFFWLKPTQDLLSSSTKMVLKDTKMGDPKPAAIVTNYTLQARSFIFGIWSLPWLRLTTWILSANFNKYWTLESQRLVGRLVSNILRRHPSSYKIVVISL